MILLPRLPLSFGLKVIPLVQETSEALPNRA